MEGSLEREKIRTRMICDTVGMIVGNKADGMEGEGEGEGGREEGSMMGMVYERRSW